MPDHQFVLPTYFDYGATFLWATSGALLAARRGFAIMGIVTVAMVSSTGGGLLRDGLFLQDGAPVLLRTPVYLELIGLAVVLVVLIGGRVSRGQHFHHLVGLVDAVGLGAYAVVGMGRAMDAGLSLPGVAVVGMVNAVGGGVLRDVLMRQDVSMFKPGTVEEAAALIGCGLYLFVLRYLLMEQVVAAWVTIVVVFAIRMAAIRFNIQSTPLKAFEQDWKETSEGREYEEGVSK